MTTRTYADRCPGVFRPWLADDGAIVRLRIPGGRVGASALLGLVALVQGDIHPTQWSWRVWSGMLFLAVLGTSVAYTWFTAAVHQLGAGHTSVFINLVPVFAVLQAAWLLDERLGLSVLLGGLLVIAGVALTTMHTSQKTTSLEKTA